MVHEATDGWLEAKLFLNIIFWTPCGIRGSDYRGVRDDAQLAYERRP